MTPETIRLLVWLGIGTAIFLYVRSHTKDFILKFKENLFTPHSFAIAFMYALIVGGLLIPYFWINYTVDIYDKPQAASAKK